MGHVINPIAMRVGWFSNWIDTFFVKLKYYPEYLHSILRLRNYLFFFLKHEIWEGFGLFHSHFVILQKYYNLYINIFIYDGQLYSKKIELTNNFLELFKRYRRSFFLRKLLNFRRKRPSISFKKIKVQPGFLDSSYFLFKRASGSWVFIQFLLTYCYILNKVSSPFSSINLDLKKKNPFLSVKTFFKLAYFFNKKKWFKFYKMFKNSKRFQIKNYEKFIFNKNIFLQFKNKFKKNVSKKYLLKNIFLQKIFIILNTLPKDALNLKKKLKIFHLEQFFNLFYPYLFSNTKPGNIFLVQKKKKKTFNTFFYKFLKYYSKFINLRSQLKKEVLKFNYSSLNKKKKSKLKLNSIKKINKFFYKDSLNFFNKNFFVKKKNKNELNDYFFYKFINRHQHIYINNVYHNKNYRYFYYLSNNCNYFYNKSNYNLYYRSINFKDKYFFKKDLAKKYYFNHIRKMKIYFISDKNKFFNKPYYLKQFNKFYYDYPFVKFLRFKTLSSYLNFRFWQKTNTSRYLNKRKSFFFLTLKKYHRYLFKFLWTTRYWHRRKKKGLLLRNNLIFSSFQNKLTNFFSFFLFFYKSIFLQKIFKVFLLNYINNLSYNYRNKYYLNIYNIHKYLFNYFNYNFMLRKANYNYDLLYTKKIIKNRNYKNKSIDFLKYLYLLNHFYRKSGKVFTKLYPKFKILHNFRKLNYNFYNYKNFLGCFNFRRFYYYYIYKCKDNSHISFISFRRNYRFIKLLKKYNVFWKYKFFIKKLYKKHLFFDYYLALANWKLFRYKLFKFFSIYFNYYKNSLLWKKKKYFDFLAFINRDAKLYWRLNLNFFYKPVKINLNFYLNNLYFSRLYKRYSNLKFDYNTYKNYMRYMYYKYLYKQRFFFKVSDLITLLLAHSKKVNYLKSFSQLWKRFSFFNNNNIFDINKIIDNKIYKVDSSFFLPLKNFLETSYLNKFFVSKRKTIFFETKRNYYTLYSKIINDLFFKKKRSFIKNKDIIFNYHYFLRNKFPINKYSFIYLSYINRLKNVVLNNNVLNDYYYNSYYLNLNNSYYNNNHLIFDIYNPYSHYNCYYKNIWSPFNINFLNKYSYLNFLNLNFSKKYTNKYNLLKFFSKKLNLKVALHKYSSYYKHFFVFQRHLKYFILRRYKPYKLKQNKILLNKNILFCFNKIYKFIPYNYKSYKKIKTKKKKSKLKMYLINNYLIFVIHTLLKKYSLSRILQKLKQKNITNVSLFVLIKIFSFLRNKIILLCKDLRYFWDRSCFRIIRRFNKKKLYKKNKKKLFFLLNFLYNYLILLFSKKINKYFKRFILKFTNTKRRFYKKFKSFIIKKKIRNSFLNKSVKHIFSTKLSKTLNLKFYSKKISNFFLIKQNEFFFNLKKNSLSKILSYKILFFLIKNKILKKNYSNMILGKLTKLILKLQNISSFYIFKNKRKKEPFQWSFFTLFSCLVKNEFSQKRKLHTFKETLNSFLVFLILIYKFTKPFFNNLIRFTNLLLSKFVNQPIIVSYFLINNNQVTGRFLSRYIALKLKHGYTVWELLSPIKKDLNYVRSLTSRPNSAFFSSHLKLLRNSFQTVKYNSSLFLYLLKLLLFFYNKQASLFYSFINCSWLNIDLMFYYFLLKNNKTSNLYLISLSFLYYVRRCFFSLLLKNNKEFSFTFLQFLKDAKILIKTGNIFNLFCEYLYDDFYLSFETLCIWDLNSNIYLNQKCVFAQNFFFSRFIKHKKYTYVYDFLIHYLHINKRSLRHKNWRNDFIGLLGFKISCSGRFSRRDRASYVSFIKGKVPLNTLQAKIDYGFWTVPIKNSAISVKVWMNKGFNFIHYEKKFSL